MFYAALHHVAVTFWTLIGKNAFEFLTSVIVSMVTAPLQGLVRVVDVKEELTGYGDLYVLTLTEGVSGVRSLRFLMVSQSDEVELFCLRLGFTRLGFT